MNTNNKFTGFTPEELSAEPTAEALQAEAEKELEAKKELDTVLQSPDNGQPEKPHKKKSKYKSLAASLPQLTQIYYDKMAMQTLKSNFKWGWDTVKAYDLTSEQKLQQDIMNAQVDAATISQYADFHTASDFIEPNKTESLSNLTVEDIKKAKASLTGSSVKANSGSYWGTVHPKTAADYQTYVMGSNAWMGPGLYDPAMANYIKEIQWYKSELETAKGVINQLSGIPGDVIYIHPYDLHELLESFVIPVVDKHLDTDNTIDINGKKYKASVLIPAKTQAFDKLGTGVMGAGWTCPDNGQTVATKYGSCDVCNGTNTGHMCDLHYPNPYTLDTDSPVK